jgi:hypothetical protein
MALAVLPMGLHQLGLVGPVTYAPLLPPPGIAADNIDQKTKDLASVVKGADTIDAQVQLAMMTLRKSGAGVQELGQRFQDIRKITDNVSRLLEQEARTALDRLVKANDITIESVFVVVNTPSTDAWAEVTVNYVNRRLPVPKIKTQSVAIRPEATS